MAACASFHVQMASIMEVLTKTALAEITKLVDDASAELRLEMCRSQSENETLKSKLLVMEGQLRAARGCGVPDSSLNIAFEVKVCDEFREEQNSMVTGKGSVAVERVFDERLSTRPAEDEQYVGLPVEKKKTVPDALDIKYEPVDGEQDWSGSVLPSEDWLEEDPKMSLSQAVRKIVEETSCGSSGAAAAAVNGGVGPLCEKVEPKREPESWPLTPPPHAWSEASGVGAVREKHGQRGAIQPSAAMDSEDASEPLIPAAVGRKRKLSKASHQREKAKIKRHSGQGKNPTVSCGHRKISNPVLCHADTLTDEDVAFNFTNLHKNEAKVDQDRMLLRLATINKRNKRNRERGSGKDRMKSRNASAKYSLLSSTPPHNIIPVCKATFLSVFGVSKDRVSRLVKYFSEHGEARPERRGGARKEEEHTERRETIFQHVSSFLCKASHYARRGTPGRRYLPGDLSVAKMHHLLQEQGRKDISYSLYYSVFCHQFNLAFGHPAKDCCITCMSQKLRMKDPLLTEEERKREIVTCMLHRRRARVFHDLLNTVHGSVTICFDMMQNLSLPKFPINQTYYSRQLNMYVFGVVVHRGERSPQVSSDRHLYVWLESENRNDGNMIVSALDHCLRKNLAENIRRTGHLRLFSDSCYGQNENLNMVGMLSSLRSDVFKDVKMQYYFPVRGHSFLPAGKVFARIEQDIRKLDTILLPDEYSDILRCHASVYVYGKDWESYDYEAATKALVEPTRSFKISDAMVLEIDGKGLGLKTTYHGPTRQHTLLKRGRNWGMYKATRLPMATTVTDVKKRDIVSLLEAFDAPAPVKAFYDHALAVTSDMQSDEE